MKYHGMAKIDKMQPTTHCIYFGFYDKNNDAFEETDNERYGLCEKWRTHFLSMQCTVTGMNNRFLCSIFFFFRSFFVRHTHKYITPNNKKSYENKNWECEKKSLPHSFAYRYKNICRLMIILPKFIGPQHCAAFTKIKTWEKLSENTKAVQIAMERNGTTVASSRLLLYVCVVCVYPNKFLSKNKYYLAKNIHWT